ncbi:hypothetical protein Tco_1250341 [Tanacetum coccineum]
MLSNEIVGVVGFWGASVDKRKLAWIKWTYILASFDKGGLGVGSLKAFNHALLLKWRWRLLKHPSALRVNVLKSIHGEKAGLDLKGCQTNGIWARIVGSIYHLHSSGYIPLNSFCFNVGDGSLIRFWKDIWLGDSPLCTRYNHLFHLEKNQNCLIKDCVISSLNIVVGSDAAVFSLSFDGIYTVSIARNLIDDCMLHNSLPCTRWCKTLPRKVNVFMWRMFLDKLPHRLNISYCGLDIPSIMCPVCNGPGVSSISCSLEPVKIGMLGLFLGELQKMRETGLMSSLLLLVGSFGGLGIMSFSILKL